MKQISTIIFFFTCATVLAQPDAESAIKGSIDRFFEGMHSRDTAAIRSVLGDSVSLQTIARNPAGQPMLRTGTMDGFITSIASIPDSVEIREHLLDYVIQVDGDMAHAWTPYEFYLQGELSHCGVNSFQLFNDGNTWRIIYIVDTRRRAGCRE